jgi:hypothetical protein
MKKGDWVYIGAGEYLKVGSTEHDAHVQRVAELARAAEGERVERARAKQAAKAVEEEAGKRPDALINLESLTAKVTKGDWRLEVDGAVCFFFYYSFADPTRRLRERRTCPCGASCAVMGRWDPDNSSFRKDEKQAQRPRKRKGNFRFKKLQTDLRRSHSLFFFRRKSGFSS